MINKLSIRWRMTLLIVLLLLVCCLGLTMVLNYSANRMADAIEAVSLIPMIDAVEEEIIESPHTQVIPAIPSTAARKSFLNESILWMLIIVSAGGALTFFVAAKVLRPLSELSVQMKNRTIHNLSETLPVPQTRDEISALTASFNDMTIKLDDAFSMQQRFAQSAAHELRTPLTVMKTKLQVFHKKPSRTVDEYETLLNGIEDQTERLSALVMELLDFTCLDAVEYDEKILLKELLKEIRTELSTMAEDRQVIVDLICPDIILKGNQNLLHRAFYNLVENALKYNVLGGHVTIAAAHLEGGTSITVSDTGLGLPAEQRDLIFEPFYRIDKSRSRQMGGAGLGLATVKSIVEQHGGKISAAENPSGGSIFTVTLL